MTEKNNPYQEDIVDTSFDEEYDVDETDNDSYEEEEHFAWWLRYGGK